MEIFFPCLSYILSTLPLFDVETLFASIFFSLSLFLFHHHLVDVGIFIVVFSRDKIENRSEGGGTGISQDGGWRKEGTLGGGGILVYFRHLLLLSS